MYRRPKFLEVLLQIRREMAQEADYDVDLFAELARSGSPSRIKGANIDQPTTSKDGEPVKLQTTGGVST